jgi:phage recombination protein Bet
MNANNAVATFNTTAQLQAVPAFEITREQIDLIKQTVMPQASDLELDLFINFCRTKRLDPLSKQVYATRQKNGTWQFFSSIDGLRVIAQRSGEYLGQTAPFWCGPDGEWRDVWLSEDNPSAAKIGVWKRGNSEPTWGVATFKSYGRGKQGNWTSMPDVMLAKCAEAIALRKAFPDDLSGVYVKEEFTEASDPEPIKTPPRPRIDVVEAQVRGIPIDGDIIDADTGGITGQQELPENGTDMMSNHQRGEIMFLAGKLGWTDGEGGDVDLFKVNAFAGEQTGISNIDNLSAQRASLVITAMREKLPKGGRRAS